LKLNFLTAFHFFSFDVFVKYLSLLKQLFIRFHKENLGNDCFIYFLPCADKEIIILFTFIINSQKIDAKSAFRSYDKAALVCVDMNDLREVASLAEKSSSFYQQHGSPESAAQVLSRAAKTLENTLPDQALHLYQRATDVVLVRGVFNDFVIIVDRIYFKKIFFFFFQIEDSYRQAVEYVNKMSRLHVKLKQ